MTRALIACLCLLLLCAQAARANNRPVTIDEVIQLTQSAISDETIITFLETHEIGFVPSAQDIVRLRAAGVSEGVIRYLLQRTAAVQPPVYGPPVAYSPGYSVPGYPAAYYTPAYAAGAVFLVGFPIVPHWLHEHHISHVAPHGTVSHVFGGGVHVIAGHGNARHGGASPFASPLHPSGSGHGVTLVGLTPVGASYVTGAGHIGTAHGASVHGGAIVAAASGGGHGTGGSDHATATHGGSHSDGGH